MGRAPTAFNGCMIDSASRNYHEGQRVYKWILSPRDNIEPAGINLLEEMPLAGETFATLNSAFPPGVWET